MNASDIIANLGALSWELTQQLAEYKRLNVEAAKARQAYKVAHASALLRGEGPMEGRKAAATVATASLLLAMEIAEAEFDNCRAELRVTGQRLDSGRTIASTIRSDQFASGAGV